MKIHGRFIQEREIRLRRASIGIGLLCGLAVAALYAGAPALAQNAPAVSGASSVRSFAGGVAPLFNLGGGSLYIDNQGTQGFIYTPGRNFESFNFRNPTTGQAWSGAVMTFGPQLSIGLIQGANQLASPIVLPGPPPQTSPLPPIESGLLDEFP